MITLLKRYYLDLTFACLVIFGLVVATKLVYLTGIDFWNWEILPASAPAALRETAENYYTLVQVEVALMYIFIGILCPFVATMVVAYYNDPELHPQK